MGLSFFVLISGTTKAQNAIQYSGNPGFCPGGSILLTANNATGGSAIQWKKDGNDLVGANAKTYTASAAGIYSVVVDGNTYPDLVITAFTKPSASFTSAPSGNCANDPIHFTNTSSPISGSTYLWSFGDPNSSLNSSTAKDTLHRFIGTAGTGTQNFNVQLTVTNSDGCTDSKTNTVTVKKLAGAALNGQNSKVFDGENYFTACGAGSASFNFSNNTATSGNTNFRIVWGDGSVDYTSATFSGLATHTYSLGTTTLLFIVTAPGGCIDTATYKIYVGSNPTVGLTNPGSTSICAGDQLTFPIADASANPPGTTYTVTFNDGSAATIYNHPAPASVTHQFNSSSCGTNTVLNGITYNGSFYASIQAKNPCFTSAATVVPITVSQKPVPAMTASQNITCVNTAVTFSNNSAAYNAALGGTSCTGGKQIWSITPATGWTTASNMGNDFGSSVISAWTNGASSLNVTFTTAGTYTVTLKIGNEVCGSQTVTKTICVNPAPVASFTLDNTSGCLPLVVKATNTSPAASCDANTYSWTVSSAASSCTPAPASPTYQNSTSSTSANPEFSFAAPGTYTVRLITSNSGGSCSASAATQTVTIKSKPNVSISAVSSVCEGTATSPSATVNNCFSVGAATYLWSFSNGTPASATSLSPGSVLFNSAGTQTITLEATNDCGTTTQVKNITIAPKPNATVPSNVSVCAGTTIGPLNFTSDVTPTTYTWTNNTVSIGLSASGSLSSISAFSPTNNGASTVTATVTVIPTASGCTGASKSFTIAVDPRPAAPSVSSSIGYCQTTTASQLTATAAGGNTLMWYNNVGLTGGSATAPVPSTTSAGSVDYFVTQTNSFNCQSLSSKITVTVTALINNNAISADQTICSGSNAAAFVHSGASLSGGTGSFTYSWQYSTDNGNNWTPVSGATGASYSPGAVSQTTWYRRMVSSGNCTNASAHVVITVLPAITGNSISAAQTICSGTAPSLLTGGTPAGGNNSFTYQWQTSSNNSTFSDISGAINTDYQSPTLTGTTYYRRIASSGNCSNASTSLTITVNPIPVMNAVTDLSFCAGTSVTVLNFASTPGINTAYQWSNDNTATGIGAGTTGLNLPAFSATNNLNPKKSDTSVITVKPIYTANGRSCDGTPITFRRIVLPQLTAANAGPDQTICGLTSAGDSILLSANSFLQAYETGTWSIISQPSNAGGVIRNPSEPNSRFAFTKSGTYTLRWTIGNGTCSASDNVVITIYDRPSAGALTTTSTAVCNGNNIIINAPGAVGTIKKWQINPAPTNDNIWIDQSGTANGISFTNVITAFDIRLIVESAGVNSGCPGLDTSAVMSITVNPKTVGGNLSGAATVCISANSGTLTLANEVGTVTRWESSTNSGSSWSQISNNTTTQNYTNITATTWYRVLVQSGVCSASYSDTAKVIVVNTVTPSNAGADKKLCAAGSVVLGANTPVVGTGSWSVISGPSVNFTNVNSGSTSVTGLQTNTTYVFRWLITGLGSCPSSQDDVQIINRPALGTASAGADQKICDLVTKDSLTLSGSTVPFPAFQTGAWTALSGGAIKQTTVANTQVVFSSAGSYPLVWTISDDACPVSRDTVEIRVYDKPAAGIGVIGDQLICFGTSVTIPAATDAKGVMLLWQLQNLPIDPTKWKDTAVTNSSMSFSSVKIPFGIRYIMQSTGAAQGCVSRDTSALTKVDIVPDIYNQIDTASKKICQGQNVQVAGDAAVGGNGYYTYQWQRSSDQVAWTNIGGAVFKDMSFTPATSVYLRRVVFSANCSNTSDPVFVFVKPAVGKFSVSDSIATCAPLTVKFNNLTLPSQSTVWDFGDGLSGSGDSVAHTFTTIGTYTVTMTAQHIGGCTFQAIKNIVISGPLGSMQYDTAAVCRGKAVRFEASFTNSDSIRWHFGDGTTLTTTEKVIYHTYSSPGAYLPLLELMKGQGNNCKSVLKGIDTIKVDRLAIGYSYAINEICGATNVAFKDTSKVYFGIKNWRWSFGDNQNESQQNPVHGYKQTGTYPAQLIIESNSGCLDTLQKSIALHVRDIPKVSINAADTSCSGYKITYAAAVINVDVLQITKWVFSNSVTATSINTNNSYAAAGNYNAQFIAATTFGCADTVIKQITILQSPNVKTDPDATICKGQSLQLTSTGAPIYQWTPSSGLTCDNCATPKLTPLSTVNYIVTGTNAIGCQAWDTVTVKVIQPIKITVSKSDSICIGESLQLSASGAQKYLWTPQTGLSNDQSATPVATPTLSTIYRVVGSDTLNCFTDTAFVTVGVGKQPSLDLGQDLTLATGTILSLKSTVTNGPIAKWQWNPSKNLDCTTCALPMATVKENIMYVVTATTAYGCVIKDSIRIKVFCESAQVFIPNLFTPDGDGLNDVLTVRASGIRVIKSFRVFNRWGELVFEKSNFPPNEKSSGWDGKIRGVPASPEVYVYTCEVVCDNDVPYTYKGNVTLIK